MAYTQWRGLTNWLKTKVAEFLLNTSFRPYMEGTKFHLKPEYREEFKKSLYPAGIPVPVPVQPELDSIFNIPVPV